MAREPLEIGTVSFAKNGLRMELSAERRVEIILGCIQLYRPSLLVTAGYAIDTMRELVDLSCSLRSLGHSLAVVAEVHHESAVPLGDPTKHALWMISGPSGALHRFGSQAFGMAHEVPSKDCEAAIKLRLQLPNRSAVFDDYMLFGLICGEINILQGRHHPRFVCPDARTGIMSADIVVNPTHDRMGNGGTLRSKRAVLSARHRDRGRAYISCSNWDVSGVERGRQKPSPTLHTVYRSGEPLQFKELADGSDGFVYRRWKMHP